MRKMIDIKWTSPSEKEERGEEESFDPEEDPLLVGWHRGVIVAEIQMWNIDDPLSEYPYLGSYHGGEFCHELAEKGLGKVHSHDKAFHNISKAKHWIKRRVNQEEDVVNRWVDREIVWKKVRLMREESKLIDDFLEDLEQK